MEERKVKNTCLGLRNTKRQEAGEGGQEAGGKGAIEGFGQCFIL